VKNKAVDSIINVPDQNVIVGMVIKIDNIILDEFLEILSSLKTFDAIKIVSNEKNRLTNFPLTSRDKPKINETEDTIN
jgi:hypothetical protein